MKTVLLFVLIFLTSCQRDKEKALPPNILTSHVDVGSFMSLAKGKPMFSRLSTHLDLAKIEQVGGAENVVVYMARFRDNPNKIYAINTLGSEVLYSSQMKDDKNGRIGLLKDGEAITIEFKDGVRTIEGIDGLHFETFFADEYHGGSGFCQREKGETFQACYKAESDEFCDSFISCVALATQPTINILLALACSCNAQN